MHTHTRRGARLVALTTALTLSIGTVIAMPLAATAAPASVTAAPAAAAALAAPLTNLAHLDFLLDEATPPADVDGHTTYRLEEEPALVLPWTYADARDGGTFERVGGGGPVDPATGYWGQGAYNADDVARAAVVYLRDWRLTGSESSRTSAYELLRSLTYLQTADGPNAGNVVLWMQPDGTLNPSAEPVELPDPSDSGPSYWLARTIWALGEGFAAFQDDDPDFAGFLEQRLALSVDALNRQVLVNYGQWEKSDGMRVPAWLITNGADASAEAALGLAARVQAEPSDAIAATALRQLAEGIAAMSSGDAQSWPYGAILPWTESRSMWHAWGSQMPAALAAASEALGDPSLAKAAVKDAAVFTPTLLTAGGPDNGWFPTPTDRVQIAYGVDSRVQSLLAVADATGSRGFADLAAIQAAWFFGANRSAAQMYDSATGVGYDGLQPDGSVNRNSGAESTIHALLTMIALDSRPELAARAATVTTVDEIDGLRSVQAESAVATDGTLSTPVNWTGESSWAGDALTLARGQSATFDIGTDAVRRWVEPVVWSTEGAKSVSTWRSGKLPTGVLVEKGPAQGISPTAGVLLPRSLQLPVLGDRARLTVGVRSGELTLDALLVLPVISRLGLSGDGGVTQLVHSSAKLSQSARVGVSGSATTAYIYSGKGVLVHTQSGVGEYSVKLPPSGFAVVIG
ncbi:hypothetical protein [Microbacterium pumilum]|uniref:Glycogen debranching protein n=1 Tax=Microbacterium pumilum TaxID=344165 RepID=A0ABP5D3T5_9MICO